jgi:hypothetical protein
LKSDGIQCNAAANETEQVERLPEVHCKFLAE